VTLHAHSVHPSWFFETPFEVRLPHPRLVRTISDRHRKLAEIMEMIHTASLVHDDVLDECDTRRGERGGVGGVWRQVWKMRRMMGRYS
jgi:geranylgeranyl pyrophosphate synthase